MQRESYDEALRECERALVLDPGDVEARALADTARLAFEEDQIARWVADAQQELDRGAVTAASLLAERALSLNSGSPAAIALRAAVDAARRDRGEADERASLVLDAPGIGDADARAMATIAEAPQLFAAGEQGRAVELPRRFSPHQEAANGALREIDQATQRIARRRGDAEPREPAVFPLLASVPVPIATTTVQFPPDPARVTPPRQRRWLLAGGLAAVAVVAGTLLLPLLGSPGSLSAPIEVPPTPSENLPASFVEDFAVPLANGPIPTASSPLVGLLDPPASTPVKEAPTVTSPPAVGGGRVDTSLPSAEAPKGTNPDSPTPAQPPPVGPNQNEGSTNPEPVVIAPKTDSPRPAIVSPSAPLKSAADPPTPEALRAADETAIRAALTAYGAAYERLDATAVRRVFRGLTAAQERSLASQFREYRAYSLQFQDLSIAIAGDTAMVRGRVARTAVPKAGRALTTAGDAWFELQKDGGAWFIARLSSDGSSR
jgi:hypothetical protein